MNLEIRLNLDPLSKSLGAFKNQLPYAASRAINATVLKAQQVQIDRINQTFTIRRRTLPRQSVKIKPFAKKQSLSARIQIAPIGTFNPFHKFEKGDTKYPAGSAIAVPTDAILTNKGTVTKARKPRALSRAFKLKTKSGTMVIAQRRGKKRYPLRVAYVLAKSADIDPRLQFVATVTDVANRELIQQLDREIESALKTAKLK